MFCTYCLILKLCLHFTQICCSFFFFFFTLMLLAIFYSTHFYNINCFKKYSIDGSTKNKSRTVKSSGSWERIPPFSKGLNWIKIFLSAINPEIKTSKTYILNTKKIQKHTIKSGPCCVLSESGRQRVRRAPWL